VNGSWPGLQAVGAQGWPNLHTRPFPTTGDASAQDQNGAQGGMRRGHPNGGPAIHKHCGRWRSGLFRPGAVACQLVEVTRQSCCELTWVGVDRAHCCRRTGGCGLVFDDAELFDAHRPGGTCADPRALGGLVQTKNGIWLRASSSQLSGSSRAGRRAPGMKASGRQLG